MAPDKPVIMDITDLIFGWLDQSLKPKQK